MAELIAPRMLARLIGIEKPGLRHTLTLRACGVREIAAGLGIFAKPSHPAGLWARVAGDVLDLGLLALVARNPRAQGTQVAVAVGSVLAVTAVDVLGARKLDQATGAGGPVKVMRSITINRPVAEVYAFWRDFEQFPLFMKHLESVQDLGGGRSRWCAKAPLGTVEWEAIVVDDVANQRIAWRSADNSDIRNSGVVTFTQAPGGRGTELTVELEYSPPVGRLGALVAKLVNEEPGQQTDDDLRRLKQVLEVGEVVHSDASIHTGMHPSRPSTLSAGVGVQS